MTCITESIHFILNGTPVTADVPVDMDALTMLRDVLKLRGIKYGCGEGECGACTLLVDGVSANACLMFAVQCADREVTTIEGLRADGGLCRLQQEFINEGAVQCGFCTPGMIMQAAALLRRTPRPGAEEVKRSLEGNLCRCTGYRKIIDAVVAASLDTVDGDPGEAASS